MRLPALIALLGTAAAAAGGGKLVAVRPATGPDHTVVQLDADQPLSFTTLKLGSPARIVVDLADTTADGVAAEQEVAGGAVRRIAVAAAGARTTRVVIELDGDAEFDVRAAGTRIEVRIPNPAAAIARKTTANATPAATATTTEMATATGTATPAATATATEMATATGTATPPATATTTEIATATGTATPPATGTATATPAGTATPTGTPTATPTATPTTTATPTATATSAATVTPTPTDAEARATEAAQANVPAGDAAEIPEVRERAALPTVALVGSQRPGPVVTKSVTVPVTPPTKGHAAITGIGFRAQSGGEVIVRSDRPLQYGVSSSDRAVLLHLPNAAIRVANNRRPLDTRVFGGTVQRVVPRQVPGGTEVRIELREPAEVHLNQTGSLLTLSFTPGS